MRKHTGALVAAAVIMTALTGILYRSRDLFDGTRNESDQRPGQEASGPPRLTQEVVPPDPDVAALDSLLKERDEIADAVIEGKLTLAKAAARFRAINASRPPNLPVRPEAFPGQTEEERVCRQVMAFVKSKLEGRPEASALLARLESELQMHLAADGAIHGPDYPAQAQGWAE